MTHTRTYTVRKRVRVNITGEAGSGKSTVAAAIAKALSDLGCENVIFKDGDDSCDETYSTLNRHLFRDPDRAKRVLPNVEVEITTMQMRRGVI